MTHDSRRRLDAMISEQAAEWFIEFRLGDIDSGRRREFDAWLRASPEHLRAYLEIAAIWHESGSIGMRRRADAEELIALARSGGNVVPWTSVPGSAPENMGCGPRACGAEHSSSRVTAEAGVVEAPEGSTKKVAAAVKSWMGRLSLAAAILLILVGGAVFGWHELYRTPVYSTQVGEQRSLRLSDGSTVELNSRSRLRVQFSGSLRAVELIEGQALFHVAKDAARPFVVRSAQTSVRAVGTRFDVYKTQAGTVVTVLEGSVAVSGGFPGGGPLAGAANTSGDIGSSSDEPVTRAKASGSPSRALRGARVEADGVLLSAGEQLSVTPLATGRPTRANVEAATAWTQRQLILENAPLSQVAEEFNRYSARKLITEDHGEPALKLSGVFSTDPDFLIRYLRERPDIVVSETSTEVRIVRHPNL